MEQKKVRVLTLIGSLSEGGAQHMVYELHKYLNQTQFEPIILCYEGKCEAELEKKVEARFCVHYLNVKGSITPKTIQKVLKKIKELKPDIIHAHLGGLVYGTIWALLGRKRKLLITAHTKPSGAFGKSEPLVRWLLRYKKRTTKVVAVSEENQKLLTEYLSVDTNCAVVNNGIDIANFYRKKHDVFTYVNVARQDEIKNQAAIIESFHQIHAQYPDTRLLLVGDGPCHEMLLERTEELGLLDCVEFPGMVGNTEDYYAVADVYVQSSHIEAMPLSLLEAMAAELPIVSTDVGGIRDIVKANGILVPDGSIEDLTQAMLAMYQKSEEERAEMGKCALSLVQAYSAEQMAREYEKLYLSF